MRPHNPLDETPTSADGTSHGSDKQVVDLIVERLRAWGTQRIYGYAGDGNNPLLGALRRAGNAPEFVQAKHEESAAFMAVGDAKFAGGVGVVTSTQGPGAIHLLTGLYDAKLDSAPVVALVAQQHQSVLGSDYQQEIDLPHVFHDVAAPFVQLVSTPEQLPMVLDRAFRSALAKGHPAVIILPHGVQSEPAPDLGQAHGEVVTAPRWTSGRLMPREEDMDAAAELINAGERIAILAGQGVKQCGDAVLRLADHLGAGVATSLLGKPYIDETHPLATGTMGHLGTTASAGVLQGCDTLLIIGSNDPWTEFYPPPGQARAVQIDTDPAVIANRYPVEVGMASDSGAAIDALLDRLTPRGRTPWRDEVERIVRGSREVARERADVSARPLNPELVVRRFGEHLADDVQLAIDVGSSVYHYVRQLTLPSAASAHLSSTLASMGCGIPYGLSAKESANDRPVAVIAGDGAMLMLGNSELVTVAERWRTWQDPRFVVLVLHNHDLAEVTWEQREAEQQPRFAPSQDIPSFDFAGYAELLGIRGIRVGADEDLAPALREAFAADTPVLIEAITDPDVPLLPPFPHGRAMADSMRVGLQAEGEAGARALRLLDTYAQIEEKHA